VQAQLEAFRASAPEDFVAGYCQMAAFTAGKSPVPSGCHCLKLIARHAVRAPNRDQGHNYIHPHILFALSFGAANILSVDDYRSVKIGGFDSPSVPGLNTAVPFTTFSRESIVSLSSSWGGLFGKSALDSKSLGAFFCYKRIICPACGERFAPSRPADKWP
jgi:hypothetical protein